MKRLVSVILIFALFSTVAGAYSGGTGTGDDPYQIANANDLLELAADTGNQDKNFILTADIDLRSYSFTFSVIGNISGIFDGAGYKVKNLTIDTEGNEYDYLGLFGQISSLAEVKNLGVENFRITGGDRSDYIGGLAGSNQGRISNCFSTGKVTSGFDAFALGGLVGGNLLGAYVYAISNCYSTGAVIGGDNAKGIGGLVGYNNSLSINNSYSTVTVRGGDDSHNLGGLVGDNAGLFGWIDNCYSTGTVTGGKNSSSIGGLAGLNNIGCIRKCYSTGTVRGGVNCVNLGGLVGLYNYGIISDDYYLAGSVPDNGYGEPLTAVQMKQQASFAGWDFVWETTNGTEEIWSIKEGAYYPKLAWQIVTKVSKCSVKAGKDNKDSISVSGLLDDAADYFFSAGNVIEITIKSKSMNRYCEPNFPINDKTFKNGRYSYTGIDNGIKKSFKYDAKTRKFTFSASDVNLMGLSCPIMMHIHIGNYFGTDVVDETIVNAKMPVPISLMMGVNDNLRVDKIQIKQNLRKPNSDQLIVKGGFAVADTSVNMVDSDLNIILNGDPFMIPQGKLKPNRYNDRFTCTKVELGDGRIAYIDFNFKRCTFSATIKNADIPELTGPVELGVMFGDFDESVLADLP